MVIRVSFLQEKYTYRPASIDLRSSVPGEYAQSAGWMGRPFPLFCFKDIFHFTAPPFCVLLFVLRRFRDSASHQYISPAHHSLLRPRRLHTNSYVRRVNPSFLRH